MHVQEVLLRASRPSIAYVTGWFAYVCLYVAYVCACVSHDDTALHTSSSAAPVSTDPIDHLFITCCMLCGNHVAVDCQGTAKVIFPGCRKLDIFTVRNFLFSEPALHKNVLYVILGLRL